MKITNEQIKAGLNEAYKKAGHNAYFGNGFHAGVEFALNKVSNTDLLICIKEYKHYFECNWDFDPDLLSADQERDHYRWCIDKLSELGERSYPNYIQKIDEKENQVEN